MLPEKYRLSPKEFRKVYESGLKNKGEYGMLIGLRRDDLSNPKIGIVVTSKIGNAVVRHRITRWIRDISSNYFENGSPTPLLLEYISFRDPESYLKLKEELIKQFDILIKKLK